MIHDYPGSILDYFASIFFAIVSSFGIDGESEADFPVVVKFGIAEGSGTGSSASSSDVGDLVSIAGSFFASAVSTFTILPFEEESERIASPSSLSPLSSYGGTMTSKSPS